MTKYYLAARGNHLSTDYRLYRAYRSIDAALKAYLSTHSEDAKRYAAGDLSFQIGLGVSFINDEFNSPVFTVCEAGTFTRAACHRLESWADWYELDDVKPLYTLD